MHEGSPLRIADRHLPRRFGFLQIDCGTCVCNFEIPHLRSSTLILRGVKERNDEITWWSFSRLKLHDECSRPTAVSPTEGQLDLVWDVSGQEPISLNTKCFDRIRL